MHLVLAMIRRLDHEYEEQKYDEFIRFLVKFRELETVDQTIRNDFVSFVVLLSKMSAIENPLSVIETCKSHLDYHQSNNVPFPLLEEVEEEMDALRSYACTRIEHFEKKKKTIEMRTLQEELENDVRSASQKLNDLNTKIDSSKNIQKIEKRLTTIETDMISLIDHIHQEIKINPNIK